MKLIDDDTGKSFHGTEAFKTRQPFLNLGILRDILLGWNSINSSHRDRSEIIFHKHCVYSKGNPSVMIQIDLWEQLFYHIWWNFDWKNFNSFAECFTELLFVHHLLSTSTVLFSQNHLLNGDLSELIFHAKVGYFIDVDWRISIAVKSFKISHIFFNFRLIFLQALNQKMFNFFSAE